MAHRKLIHQAISLVVAITGGLAYLGAEQDIVLSAAIFLLIGLAMAVWIHRRLPGWTHVAPLPVGVRVAPVWWTIAAGNGLGMRKTTRYEREHPDRVLVARVRPCGETPTWAAPRA